MVSVGRLWAQSLLLGPSAEVQAEPARDRCRVRPATGRRSMIINCTRCRVYFALMVSKAALSRSTTLAGSGM